MAFTDFLNNPMIQKYLLSMGAGMMNKDSFGQALGSGVQAGNMAAIQHLNQREEEESETRRLQQQNAAAYDLQRKILHQKTAMDLAKTQQSAESAGQYLASQGVPLDGVPVDMYKSLAKQYISQQFVPQKPIRGDTVKNDDGTITVVNPYILGVQGGGMQGGQGMQQPMPQGAQPAQPQQPMQPNQGGQGSWYPPGQEMQPAPVNPAYTNNPAAAQKQIEGDIATQQAINLEQAKQNIKTEADMKAKDNDFISNYDKTTNAFDTNREVLDSLTRAQYNQLGEDIQKEIPYDSEGNWINQATTKMGDGYMNRLLNSPLALGAQDMVMPDPQRQIEVAQVQKLALDKILGGGNVDEKIAASLINSEKESQRLQQAIVDTTATPQARMFASQQLIKNQAKTQKIIDDHAVKVFERNGLPIPFARDSQPRRLKDGRIVRKNLRGKYVEIPQQ